MAKYLIGGSVNFDDEIYELRSLNEPDRRVSPGAAACRCLRSLLQAGGQIVTKKALLYEGWEQYGSVVTANSVNQAIVQIRKGFQAVGAGFDPVVTVPRIGYKISDGLEFMTCNPGLAKAKEPGIEEAATGSAEVGDIAVSPALARVPGYSERRTSRRWITRAYRSGAALVAVMVLSVGAAVVAAPKLNNGATLAVADTEYLPVDNEVGVFVVKTRANDRTFIDAHKAMLKKSPPAASDMSEHIVYINDSVRPGEFNYLLCKATIRKDNAGCLAYRILDRNAAQES